MNFLALCQNLALRGGMGGGAGPTSVAGQVGENARIVEWVKRAWLDIQSEHVDWRFLWAQHTGTIYAGDTEVVAPDDWAYWDTGHLVVGDQRITTIQPYEEYIPTDGGGQGHPASFVQMPNGNLKLIPVSDAEYTYTLDYYTVPQELVNNNDAPLCPAQFHDVIVLWALQKYAHFESAPEVISNVSAELGARLTALRASQLPHRAMFTDSHYTDFRVGVE
jgi:hypothetical protein